MAKPQNPEMGVKMLSQLLRRMIECRRSCQNRFQNKTAPSLRLRAMIVVFLLLALGRYVPSLTAQGLDAAALLKPATDTWPTYNGDYSGRRFSTLDQINAGNIGRSSALPRTRDLLWTAAATLPLFHRYKKAAAEPPQSKAAAPHFNAKVSSFVQGLGARASPARDQARYREGVSPSSGLRPPSPRKRGEGPQISTLDVCCPSPRLRGEGGAKRRVR